MIADAATIVMFALRSALRLGRQARQAYVDNTKQRELMLPFPNFFSALTADDAATYFNSQGKNYVAGSPRLKELLTNFGRLSETEKSELKTFHVEFSNLDLARQGMLRSKEGAGSLDADQLEALLSIRQWKRGDNPNPSTLQRLAGTFIEIGLDYFQSVPGALHEDSTQGKLLHSVLDALDEIPFESIPLQKLPERLVVAALDSVSSNAAFLTGDSRAQELVKIATLALIRDVQARIDELRKAGGPDAAKEGRVGDWAELVFRSVLTSAGKTVLESPGRYLSVKSAGEQALVSHVGDLVLGLVLEPVLDAERIFSVRSLEKVTLATLKVVGEHPELVVKSGNLGLKNLLSSIASKLGQYDTLETPDLLPDLVRLILEKTGTNLALLWPDLADPGKNLLLTMTQITLEVLARPPAAGQTWKLSFGSDDMVGVTDSVLDSMAANPGWILDKSGPPGSGLRTMLESVMAVLRARADDRISGALGIDILRAAISAVATRKEFLDMIPASNQPLVAGAIDVVLRIILNPELDKAAAWQLLRAEVIRDLVTISLRQLSKIRLDPTKADLLEAGLELYVGSVEKGDAWNPEALTMVLEKALVN
jgi:hypothetical protein